MIGETRKTIGGLKSILDLLIFWVDKFGGYLESLKRVEGCFPILYIYGPFGSMKMTGIGFFKIWI